MDIEKRVDKLMGFYRVTENRIDIRMYRQIVVIGNRMIFVNNDE